MIEPNRISGSRSCLYQTKSTGRTSGQGFSRKHIQSRTDAVKLDFTIEK